MSNSLNASSRDDFQALWSQLPDQPRITPDQVRARALRLARDVRRRALAGAIILVLGIGHPVIATLFRTRPIAWWEWVLIGYLVAFAMAILWITRATRRRPEPAAAGVECVQWYRRMLEKERDMHHGRSLGFRLSIPLFGLVVVVALNSWTNLAGVPLLPAVAAAAVWCGFIWLRSRHRVRLFQNHIDLLADGLEG